MKNKFLNTGEAGFNPIRKFRIILSGLNYAVRYDFSVAYKVVLSVIILSIFFFLRQWIDFLFLAAATVMMLHAELFNSAIEAVCDLVTTEENYKVKVIKDIAAAAAGLNILLWLVVLGFETYRVLYLILPSFPSYE